MHPRGNRLIPLVLGMLAACVLAGAPAAAQSGERGLRAYRDQARCSFCHGWDGSGLASEYGGVAPSLRATLLSRDEIAEVVRCGRPGTNMPYHDRKAYTDGRCYGVTEAELGAQMPPKPLEPLSDRAIAAVADYVAGELKGKGAATHAECVAYWGADTRFCDRYAEEEAAEAE